MKHSLAPYQVFFPLGIMSALLAVGVWLVQDLHWFSTPAVFIHSRLIAGGFIWSFISGFLMTAIPRMTGAVSARPFEYAAAGTLLGAQIISAWFMDGRWFYGINMGLVAFLLLFGGWRLIKAAKRPPVFFSHVGLAMVLALIGGAYHFRGDSMMGIHLYHVGGILLLVLGIGTRFFSFLSGLPSEFENAAGPARRWGFHTLGVLVALLLFACGKGFLAAYLGLSLAALVYIFLIWNVWRPSSRPSALKYGVRVVALMIPLAFFMCWLQPGFFITWLHLLFIGAFSLITFSVATRVTLAHGSYPIDLETKSGALWFFVGFLLLALAARILYGLSDGVVAKSFLHLAGTCWIVAIVGWCRAFLPRVWKSGQEAAPACR
jgi:uncharacterized protein involved in response to NO